MRKKAQRALKWTHFTPETHPALCALIDYGAQAPRLEWGNYGNRTSYRSEADRIAKQWRSITYLIDAADHYRVTDDQIIDASQWAYSGRMNWQGHAWEYCTGQYWPVEYRAAVAAILRAVLPIE